MNVERILEDIELRRRGLYAVAYDPRCQNILAEYRRYGALRADVESALPDAAAPTGDTRFTRYFKDAYAKPGNYVDPVRWGLYWAVTRATSSVLDLIAQRTHEPELNGAFLAAIAAEVRRARMDAALGASDLLALHISNQAALGNEARSGSDFGIIVEQRTAGRTRYWSALVQAKRAKSSTVDIHRAAGDTTQRALLEGAREGVGAFLFYNEFGDPGVLPPTVISASLLKSHKGDRVDSLNHAHDFAAWLAFGFPGGSVVGAQEAYNAERALDIIFNREDNATRPNNLLVAVLDEERLSAADLRQIEIDWRKRVHMIEEGSSGESSRPRPSDFEV